MSESAAMPAGALQHVKVPDLSRVLAGPWAAPYVAGLHGQPADDVLTRHLGLTAEALQNYRDKGVLG